MELQAARQHRNRQLLRVGGGKQELHMRGRLFEGLEQRVETVPGKHMHFVDQVHLVAATSRRVLHVIEQFARVIHLGARAASTSMRSTNRPSSTSRHDWQVPPRLRADTGFTIQGFGQDTRDRGLADAARTGKQKGVMQAVVIEAIDERRAPHASARPGPRTGAGATCVPAPDSSWTFAQHG